MSFRNYFMKLFSALFLVAGFSFLSACAKPQKAGDFKQNSEKKKNHLNVSFDNISEGTIPEGWREGATKPSGKLAEWEVVNDPHKSGNKIMSLTKVYSKSEDVFNLCWTGGIRFTDGVIRVKILAREGMVDQGGGIAWRIVDDSNYYIARYNPLEKNFRVYYVVDGHRQILDSADADIAAREWVTIEIHHSGDSIEGWLDGKKLFSVKDRSIMREGGVGLWTKADAVTYFDDFSIEFADENRETLGNKKPELLSFTWPRIGISIDKLSGGDIKKMSALGFKHGVRVTRVKSDADVELIKGDIILSVDSVQVKDFRDMFEILILSKKYMAGDAVKLQIFRDGEILDRKITLSENTFQVSVEHLQRLLVEEIIRKEEENNEDTEQKK
ncbi:MAG: PDZ domain-containing protein [Planctomycetes bacterium]|nr:PDZ domain-containing protein [Planctomycetota bacterium]